MRKTLLLVLLVLLSLALRLPFASTTPVHIDSTNFIRAISRFDLANFRPHAPGYIFFVACGKLVNLFVGDGNLSLVIVNAAAGGITAFFLLIIASRLFSPEAGWWTAALVLLSPLSFSYGLVALSYPAAGAATAAAVWAALRAWEGSERHLPLAGLLLGLASGFRVTSAVFVSLPFLWALLRTVRSGRPGAIPRAAVSALFAAMAALAWFIPLVASVGGLSAWGRTVRGTQTVFFIIEPGHPYLGLLLDDLTVFSISGILSLGAAWLAVPALRGLAWDERFLFLLLWGLPSCIFYILLHQGQIGYWIPTLAQAVWILGGLALSRMRRRWLILPFLAANAALVLFGGYIGPHLAEWRHEDLENTYRISRGFRFWCDQYTANGIRRRDGIVHGIFNNIRENHPPDVTWIFTSGTRWMDWSSSHLAAMMPEYEGSVAALVRVEAAPPLGPGERPVVERSIPIPEDLDSIILLHPELLPYSRNPDRLSLDYSIEGEDVWRLDPSGAKALELGPGFFRLDLDGAEEEVGGE